MTVADVVLVTWASTVRWRDSECHAVSAGISHAELVACISVTDYRNAASAGGGGAERVC